MKPIRQVTSIERQTIIECLCARLGERSEVRFAYLHGSFAKGCQFRDIDVAVSIDAAQPSTVDPTAYELDLEAVLEHAIGFPLDVRVVDHAPASFRYAVTRGEALVVRDPEALARFRESSWNDYLDFAPLREEALRDLARSVRRRRD
jgi:uncharacterized protein